MMPREELEKTPEYWTEHCQNAIFREVSEYVTDNDITPLINVMTPKTMLEVLDGESNLTMKQMITLSLAMDKKLEIKFK